MYMDLFAFPAYNEKKTEGTMKPTKSGYIMIALATIFNSIGLFLHVCLTK